MQILAVNNFRPQRSSFKSNSINVAPAPQQPSEDFKRKKKQIYSIAAPLCALTSIFAYFYIFHNKATKRFFQGRMDEAVDQMHKDRLRTRA